MKVHLTSFGLPHSEASESHDAFAVKSWDETVIAVLAVAVVEGDRLYGLNVGDSRVYLSRDGRLAQLSRDHVAERAGMSHVLDKAVGLELEIEPHLFETELRDGDVALLCSDGVFN